MPAALTLRRVRLRRALQVAFLTMRGEGADLRPAGFSSPIARQFAAPPMRVGYANEVADQTCSAAGPFRAPNPSLPYLWVHPDEER